MPGWMSTNILKIQRPVKPIGPGIYSCISRDGTTTKDTDLPHCASCKRT